MTEHTRDCPDGAPVVTGAVVSLSGATDALGALRIVAGEADALAAVTAALFDDADWSEPDPVIVDRVASLLGLQTKVTATVIVAVEKVHGMIADAMPAAVDSGEW